MPLTVTQVWEPPGNSFVCVAEITIVGQAATVNRRPCEGDPRKHFRARRRKLHAVQI
jgi:hypothetical protein